jgi:hypothetical protein
VSPLWGAGEDEEIDGGIIDRLRGPKPRGVPSLPTLVSPLRLLVGIAAEPDAALVMCLCREEDAEVLLVERTKFLWLLAKRSISSCVAGLETAGVAPSTPSPEDNGLHRKQRPLSTRPCSFIGINLKSFLLKHLRPHLTHSPRFFRSSSRSSRFMTEPVELKSVPKWSMMTETG